jgi:hypothetical protein
MKEHGLCCATAKEGAAPHKRHRPRGLRTGPGGNRNGLIGLRERQAGRSFRQMPAMVRDPLMPRLRIALCIPRPSGAAGVGAGGCLPHRTGGGADGKR